MSINIEKKPNSKNFLTGMKIGVDLDDTLGQFMPAFIEFHNDKYGTNFEMKNFKTLNLREIWNGTETEEGERVHEFHKSPYNKNMKTVDGAREVLEKLKKNNELFVVTARRDIIREETEEWVEKNFPNIFSKIYFTNKHSQDGTETTKEKICDNLDIDILIEDNLKYVLECLKPNRKVYLIDYPWNQCDKLPDGVTRIHSWKEIENSF